MTHGFEQEIAQAADGSLAPELQRALDAHLAGCDACRALLAEQREGRALLMGRPIVAVRDLSAGIRRTLEAERPWIDRLNINWRKWSLSAAPIAAALVVIAFTLVRSVDSAAETTTAAQDATIIAPMSESAAPVVSALWSTELSEDAVFNLFLRARPDDELSSYSMDLQSVKGK